MSIELRHGGTPHDHLQRKLHLGNTKPPTQGRDSKTQHCGGKDRYAFIHIGSDVERTLTLVYDLLLDNNAVLFVALLLRGVVRNLGITIPAITRPPLVTAQRPSVR